MKLPFFLFGTLVLLAPMGFAAGAKVCVEAEKPDSIWPPAKIVRDKAVGVSGNGYVQIPFDPYTKSVGGKVVYKFNVKTPGVYSVWTRTFWQKDQGNSIKVSVNGDSSHAKILGEDGTYDAWHWVGGRARVTLKAGMNTLTLMPHETGVRIDQFCFDQETDYAPTSPRRKAR